ncbi:MAG: YbaN family protein [Rhodobacteraceae bacterium]|nr:YbaN family protein [Paracoccaceae bacterium]
MTRLIWFIIGGSSLILGTLGIFLPLLPTVPFYLLAAFGFSKSSTKIHSWMLNHRVFGPDIRSWNENRVIHRRAKLMASAGMIGSFMLALAFSVPLKYIAIQIICFAFVARFIWKQKES